MWDDFNTAVQAIDVAALDRAGLGDLAGEIGRTRAVLDGLEARITAGLRRLGASQASAAETLRQRTGCSTREAKHRARRAEALRRMPNVADALSSGRLTGEHASALARAAAETSPEAVDRDAGLLVEASSMPADAASSKARDWVRHRQTNDDLERLHQWQRRNRSLLFTSGEGGMIAGIAKFDRVSGAQFQNLVEALADRLYRADGGRDNPHARTRPQCRHDALLMLVGLEPAIPPPGIPRADSSGGSAPSSDSVDSTPANSARPSDPAVGREAGLDGWGVGGSGSAVGREAGLDGSGVGGSDPAVGREAGNGRASPGLAVPRPTPLAEFASGGPTRGSSCPGAGSVPNSDMGDSGTGSSGPSGHRPVLEVAGHGSASPRLSTPHQELRPDPASCSLPGTAPDATRGTISGPSPGSSAGSSGSSARRSDSGESSVGGSARRSDSGESSVGGSAGRSDLGDSRAGSGGSGPGNLRPVLEVAGHGRASPRLATSRQELLSDLAGCSPPGTAPDAGVGTIHGPGPGSIHGPGSGPGVGVGTIHGPGSGPGVGVGAIHGPGSGVGVGAIHGPGSGPGVGVGTIHRPGSGPDAGVGTIHGPGSGFSPSSSLGCTCGRGFGPKAQLCVVMDVPYLATNGERGRCEIPGVGAIARSELERLGCDPDIYGILFDQQGLPLYHGRKTRRVSPQQWRVLVARDKGCVICGAHPNWCQAHHVRYWRLGGPTDIDNLVLLCHAHHRWVHDNEIILQRGPNGWNAPTGRPPPTGVGGRSARSLAPAR